MSAAVQRGFLTAEDEALKAKLSNIEVTMRGGVKQKAQVWFRMPSGERTVRYPYISIDLVDVVFAADRAHSAEITDIDYWPSEWATFAEYAAAHGITYDPEVHNAAAMRWLPYDLYYQITTHATAIQHNRELFQALLGTAYLPDRFGYLDVVADESVRWLDRTGYASNDYIVGGSTRVFSTMYNVIVSAHVPPENPFIFLRVLEVAGTLQAINDPGLVSTWANEPTP